ncbi:MAG: hypothetical protein F7C81_00150 [Desulfurococcales archaeon]|nr:hypothetical protein [Desulfurococcales archaeon]
MRIEGTGALGVLSAIFLVLALVYALGSASNPLLIINTDAIAVAMIIIVLLMVMVIVLGLSGSVRVRL